MTHPEKTEAGAAKKLEWQLGADFTLLNRQFSGAIELIEAVEMPELGLRGEAKQDTKPGTSGKPDTRVLRIGSRPAEPISLTGLAQEALGLARIRLPPGLPDVTIDAVVFHVAPRTGYFRFSGESGIGIPVTIGKTRLQAKLGLLLERESSETALTGELQGLLSYNALEFRVRAVLGKKMASLAATAHDLKLSEIVENLLGVAPPDEVPDLVVKTLSLTVDTKQCIRIHGKLELRGAESLALGVSRLPLDSLEFDFERSANAVVCLIKVDGSKIDLTHDIRFSKFQFAFAYSSRGKWKWQLTGGVTSQLFGREFDLQAQYASRDNRKQFKLSYSDKSATALLAIPKIADLRVNGFFLSITSEKNSTATWELMARGGLAIVDVIDSRGSLRMRYREGRYSFEFKPRKAKLTLPILVDPVKRKTVASLDIRFGDLLIEFAEQELRLKSSVGLSCPALLEVLPEAITGQFPEKVELEIAAAVDGVSLTVRRLLNPVNITLPPLAFAEQVEVKLGVMCLDASDLKIELTAKKVALSMSFAIGLPSELNHNLGVETVDGKLQPRLDFFKTYDPDNPGGSTLRGNLRIGTDGLGFAVLDSPFAFLRFDEPDRDNKVWCELDFGDCGAVRFQVPDFRLDLTSGSFVASGGFEVTRDLALPVFLVKETLIHMGLGVAAELLPETLPLADISILDEHDEFQAHQLTRLIEDTLGIPVPKELEQALEVFGELTNNLPDDLRSYFHIRIPRSFIFDISISPDGGVKFKAGVNPGDPPIRILYPTLGPMYIPQLQGLEFHSIAFGEVLSGALLLLELDVRVDEFDLVAIGAAMLAKDIPAIPLAAPRDLQKRLIVRELFMLIVYETAVPIPIPVFFSELGIEYRGLEGATFQTHVGFPMPKINLAGLGTVLAELISFVRDPEARLTEDALGEMDPRIVIGANYLELPAYLGGSVIGTRRGVKLPGVYGIMASILNNLKHFSLVEMIGAIPIEYRVGDRLVTLGPLSARADWLLTTPTEFMAGGFEQLVASPQQARGFLTVLPHLATEGHRRLPAPETVAPAADADAQENGGETKEEEGMVLFMKGEWGIDKVLDSEAIFGLAASKSLGFHTGFKISGDLLELLDVEIAGRVAIDQGKVLEASAEDGMAMPATRGVPFSGTGDHIVLPTLDADFGNGLTVEVWVRCLETGGESRIIDFGSSLTGDNIVLAMDAVDNGLFFGVGEGGNLRGCTRGGMFERDKWTHVSACLEKSGRLRLYKNGAELDTGNTVLPLPANVVRDRNLIGSGSGEAGSFFKGELTGLRIWGRALEPETIRARMERHINGNELELVCCWPFAAGQDGDQKTVGHEVILRNRLRLDGPKFKRRGSGPRYRSTGLFFNGTNSYLEIADPFPNGAEFTIGMWVNPRQIDDGQYHGLAGRDKVAKAQPTPGLSLAPDKGGLHYCSSDLDGKSFGGLLQNFFIEAGEWIHVGWVKAGTRYIFYRNGIEFAVASAPNTVYSGPGNYDIGRIDSYWLGLIDDVQIWDRALGPQEIKSQMRRPLSGYEPGLMTYLPFEEGFGSRTLDIARREKIRLHATQWQMAEPLELSGLDFNGRDARLYVPPGVVPTGNEITLSLWACGGDSLTGESSVIEARDANGLRVLNVHLPWSDGNVYFDCGNDGNSHDRIGKPALESDYKGKWTHWVFTKNAASAEMAIYRNGQLWHRNADTEPKRFSLPETRQLSIGSTTDGSGHYAGRIAQVSIWERALDQDQIAALLQHPLGGAEEGLVAYWPLAEGLGEVGFDLAGDCNATIKNARWLKPAMFELQGLQFDGRDDFVDMGSGIAMGGRFTVEAWVKGSRGTLLQRDRDTQTRGHLKLGFNSEFSYVDDAGRSQCLEYSGLPVGEWAHLAAVYDGSEMRVHVNGRQVAAMAVDADMAASSAISLVGYGQNERGEDYFDGVLDEVRLWNYGRSPQGIKRRMFQRLLGSEAGLIAYWPFLAGKGLRAFDYAGGNNGILRGARWHVASDLQLVGHYFDGNDYIEVADPFASDETFTISLWVNPDRINDGSYHGILGREEETAGNWYRKPGLWLSPNNGRLMYDSYSHAKTRFSGELDDFFVEPGQWVHIAWVKRGKKYCFYRNGYLVAERRAPKRFFTDETEYFIGKVDTGWVGLLDEIRIWDHARDPVEIQADMHRRLAEDVAGLSGYWPLGDKGEQFSPALSEKSRAINYGGNAGQARTFTPGGLQFDGGYDYLDLGGQLPLADCFSVEAWVNGSGSGTIYQRAGDDTSSGHIQLDFNKMFRLVDDAGQTHMLRYRGIPEREWSHIAATCDGVHMKVFVNAEEVAAEIINAGAGSSSAVSCIGNGLGSAAATGLRGRVDEIRFWNRARTADELMACMHERLCGTEPGLVSYLPCNEGIGQTAFDIAGRNNARLHGPRWVNSPLIEMEGLSFDGNDDWLSCGEVMAPLAGSWSVELWFKWNGGVGEQVLYSKKNLFQAAIRDGYLHYLWSPAAEWLGGESFAVEPGEWIHLAIVYDGIEQRLYKNAMAVFSHPLQGEMGEGCGPFILGADADDSPQAFFNGQMHSVRIWNRALTVVEVLTRRYENLNGTEPNLVGCWKLQPGIDDALVNRAARNLAHWGGRIPEASPLQPAETSRELDRIEDYFNLEGLNSSFVIAGHCHMSLFGEDVILGDILVQEKLFAFRGELDLFPRESPLQVRGGLRGVIKNRSFVFQGDMDVRLFAMTLVGGNVLLHNEGFFLRGVLFDQAISLSLAKQADNLVEFHGGLEKAVVLGTVFRLCDPLDASKGPSLTISGPQPPSLMLRGQVELLGINQAVVIAAREDNFVAVLDTKLWQLFECRLTLSGRDLERLGEFDFEVVFINGLDELVRAVVDEINRILHWASDELDQARNAVANARSVVEKGFEAEKQRLLAEAEKRRAIYLEARAKLDAQLDLLGREIDRCLAEIGGIERQIEAESRKYSVQTGQAQRELDKAQSAVNTILGEIHRTENWYNGLPAVDWPWKPNRAKEWIWVGPKIAALYTAFGTSTAALQSAKLYLAGINELQKTGVGALRLSLDGALAAKRAADVSRTRVQQDLDVLIKNTPAWVISPELVVIEITDRVAVEVFNLAEGFLKGTQDIVDSIQKQCDAILTSLESPVKIRSAGFAGRLGAAVGMVFEVSLEIEYFDLSADQVVIRELRLTCDFSDLPGTAVSLMAKLFEPLGQQQRQLVAAKAEYEDGVGQVTRPKAGET